MVRNLREPNVIWYTADQDFGRSSAFFIPFFNVPEAATITGALPSTSIVNSTTGVI